MGTLDLDAAREARAAKAEAQQEEHVIKLGGEEFTIPPEMPAEFAFALAEGEPTRGLRALFNGQYDKFVATGYSVNDLMELTEGLAELYGMDAGEAAASGSSSSSNGKRSRPTSKRTTG